MALLRTSGWQQYRTGRYRHWCGARVIGEGSRWTAKFVDTSIHKGHKTAKSAIRHIEVNDCGFWNVDAAAWEGLLGGIWLKQAFQVTEQQILVFLAGTIEDIMPERFVGSTFKKHVFAFATCSRCATPMSEFAFSERPYLDRRGRDLKRSFIVCKCGHPVWRGDIMNLSLRLITAEKDNKRKLRIRNAKGSYTAEDISKLLREQGGRCFYCDMKFTADRRHTVDHIRSLISGGTHWPENICLACPRCNSKKAGGRLADFVFSSSTGSQIKVVKKLESRLARMDKDMTALI